MDEWRLADGKVRPWWPAPSDGDESVTTRRKRAPDSAGQALGNLVRTSDWAGVTKGDFVEVSDTRLRSATWRFVAHVRNVVTGDEWIEVVGGRGGDRTLRSFPVSRVFAPTNRGRSGPRASLAEAPRLPLD